jgi:hypothetical protein
MAGPAWLADIFAVVMITVAVYCASRLVVARWWRRPSELDTAGAHVVLGVAMAGMLAGGLRFLSPGTWEAVFAAGGAWFAWQVVRVRRGAPLSQWHCRSRCHTWSSAARCSTCSSRCLRSGSAAARPR